MYDEETIFRGHEDLRSSYDMNPNPVCIFGHQINKEQLMDDRVLEIQKRFHIHPKQAYALG